MKLSNTPEEKGGSEREIDRREDTLNHRNIKQHHYLIFPLCKLQPTNIRCPLL